jgi:hypothetical protein
MAGATRPTVAVERLLEEQAPALFDQVALLRSDPTTRQNARGSDRN